ncbi:PepSY domain-containing protein [Rhodoferax sediminis]|uniref:PepSY domain-containing protein n=1 Tax=Rhodoferax sediminis TaxID=2509614 RepID=A0A515DC41_9BURK|nr:PepSY domain-containing protein [Rhodoferax sediminis]QDL37988.1 PepSY domain-containing protein [Rhodoferax sediminis]
MKQTSLLCAAVLTLTMAGTALAHGGFKCDAPKAEWKPQMELQRQLLADGWKKVRQIKIENGCYEAYGFNEQGKRVEVFFNPKTFEKVGEVKKPS